MEVIECVKKTLASSLLISSLLKVRSGMTPRFLSQNMAANEPEKKMPSTAANETSLSAYVDCLSSIHRNAHSAFFFMHGMCSMALKRRILFAHKVQYVKIEN